MPREVFVAGQVLTAAELNVVSDQSVMVFAGTAARGSAIPSPTEGMVTYRSDDDAVEVYDGSSWNAVGPGKILQVVSTTKTDTFTTTAGTPTPITGATVTITPSSTASKIFISFSTVLATSIGDSKGFQLLRDSTVIGGGTVAGSRLSAITVVGTPANNTRFPGSATFLDSPATTSSITYSLSVYADVAGRTTYIGRSAADGDDATANNSRTPLTITAMEVAG